LQNANMNTFAPKALQAAFQGHGGSYHDLESRCSERLKAGYKVRVTVRDKYRRGENRPFTRWVRWIETKPGAAAGQVYELEFGNFSSPQQRAASQSSDSRRIVNRVGFSGLVEVGAPAGPAARQPACPSCKIEVDGRESRPSVAASESSTVDPRSSGLRPG
jgi:hypothetical protein